MMFDPGMIKRLQKDLHDRIDKLKEELQTVYVEGSAGGGVVTVVCNGNSEVIEVKVKPEAIDPDDPEMLQDLLVAATNQSLQNAKKLYEENINKITGGVKLPNIF